MRQNAFGGRAPPGPGGPLAEIGGGVPTSKGEGREGNGKREVRGWEGGREKGKGKDDLHPTLFLGPGDIVGINNESLFLQRTICMTG